MKLEERGVGSVNDQVGIIILHVVLKIIYAKKHDFWLSTKLDVFFFHVKNNYF